jgi:PST family polysaccharide transporter
MAAAVMVISFAQVFWDAGMSKAIIQRQTEVSEAANVAFWINIILGFALALILFLFADIIATELFRDRRVANVLRVMTLQIFLGAFGSIHTALLQKEMKFNKLFWVRMATVAAPGFFSIPMAWYGMSYWALVVGTLVGQLAQVILLWRICNWRPKLSFNKQLAREISKFGFWVGLTGLLGWFYIWMDSLFVGSYLGTRELGLYRTGNQFIIMIFGFLFAPILPVLYSHFVGIQSDYDRLRAVMFKVIRIISFISIPLAFLIYAMDDLISVIVFGDQWTGVAFVLGIMALSHGYSWIGGANGEIYRAMGRPSYETIIPAISLGLYLLGYFISIQYGFDTFVLTRFFLGLAATGLHIIFGWVALRVNGFEVIKVVALATIIGSVALVLKIPLDRYNLNSYLQAGILSVGSVISMAGLIFLFERNGAIKDLVHLVNRKKM